MNRRRDSSSSRDVASVPSGSLPVDARPAGVARDLLPRGGAGVGGVRRRLGGGASADLAPDGRLLRRVRWRLVAWSGGSTLLVLLVLGSAIYAAVAGSLEASGVEQLRARATEMQGLVEGPAPAPIGVGPDVVFEPVLPGVVFVGPGSGTLGVIAGSDGRVLGDQRLLEELALPYRPGMDAALSGREDVRTTTLGGASVRVLSTPAVRDGAVYAVQVVQELSTEQRTLGVLLTVLGVGGFGVLVASLLVGSVYADRALVPIRESLRRQREFAADASHELRTPLAVVRGSVEHLRRHGHEPVASVGTALDDLDAETARITRLVDDLLLLARTDSGAVELQVTAVDMADVAAEALRPLSALAAARGVRLELDATPAPARGDAGRLRQVVTILVDNAIRHSPDEGVVRVAVRLVAGQPRVTVEDDGPGIRDEDLPRIFDRFWRAPGAPAGGSGLGLAIASWIVERHGGTIGAENRAEGGARLSVRLPPG